VPLGLAAAARGGSLGDEIIMRANDLVFAFSQNAVLTAAQIQLLYRGQLGHKSSRPLFNYTRLQNWCWITNPSNWN
jgi:hypothetical protein